MPLINILTSTEIKDKKLLDEITILISSLTNKSKRFVMAKIEDDSEMFFENQSTCFFVEIKLIGSIDNSEITKPICNFIYEKIGIPLDKIYIRFEDFYASMWGWNGKTFG